MHNVYLANMKRRDEASYYNFLKFSVTWCFLCRSVLPITAFISTSVFSMFKGAIKISQQTLLQHYSVQLQARNPKIGSKCELKCFLYNF